MISSMPKWVGNLFEGALKPNMTVSETSHLSPCVKKIRFEGNISRMNFQIGYASVVRVSETEYRNYTVAFHDSAKGIFEMIIHLHGNGPGSRLMDSLRTGDKLFISGPRGMKEYDPKVKQQFIFGDETSLGLACSFLPLLKQNNHDFQFCFELDEENKDVPHLLGLQNVTVVPRNGSFRDEKWISRLPVLQTAEWKGASFVLTGNARSVQTFRKVLKKTSSGKIHSQGYWLEGKKGL